MVGQLRLSHEHERKYSTSVLFPLLRFSASQLRSDTTPEVEYPSNGESRLPQRGTLVGYTSQAGCLRQPIDPPCGQSFHGQNPDAEVMTTRRPSRLIISIVPDEFFSLLRVGLRRPRCPRSAQPDGELCSAIPFAVPGVPFSPR